VTGDITRRDAAQSIIELCRMGLDPETLRDRLLPRLRRAVPADALWWATADPATLLFTSTYQEQIPERTAPYFLENEFIADDVNKWVDVARDPDGVRTLHQTTDGVMSESARYTERSFIRSASVTSCAPSSELKQRAGDSCAFTARRAVRSRRTRRCSSNASPHMSDSAFVQVW
jgi:hypothetical protein